MLLLTFAADQRMFNATLEEFSCDPLVGALPVVQADQIFATEGGAIIGSAWGKAVNGLDRISAIPLRLDLKRDLIEE